jgi:hypothetical protein
MRKTIKLPKESETFFVKSLHEGGRGIHPRQEKERSSLLDQRAAPQLEHFDIPPASALPQFAQNFLVAGATIVGCDPMDWDAIE